MRKLKLSWKPKLKGNIYCSPACGHGCTKAEYDKENDNGKHLAARLGLQWRHRVWENMGWFYEAVSPGGRIKVSECGGVYTAFLGPKSSPGGKWVEQEKTPEEAIRKVIKAAKDELNAMKFLLEDL